ncbi:MAG: diguanylate cyclase [Rhizobiales bacterium]|nr:diguanylate cyclase [Hyphomicrobiales bacterium]
MAGGRQNEKSVQIAEQALERIKALGLPATPASFELWFAYASGEHPELTAEINRRLAQNGAISGAEADRLYESFLAVPVIAQRAEVAGTQLSDEVDQVVAMIEGAIGSAQRYGDDLADGRHAIMPAIDRDTLRLIVEGLVHSTREAEQENNALGVTLRRSRQRIDFLRDDLHAAQSASLTDALTGLPNRRHFDQLLNATVIETRQSGKPFALLMCDIDHFKQYNDKYGHLTGDDVLRLVAQEIRKSLKGRDIVARFGGEEFAIILQQTGISDAALVADHLRAAVLVRKVVKRSTGEDLGRITVSIGVAEYRAGEPAEQLIERADACLGEAKIGGRNRVVDERDLGVVALAPGDASNAGPA